MVGIEFSEIRDTLNLIDRLSRELEKVDERHRKGLAGLCKALDDVRGKAPWSQGELAEDAWAGLDDATREKTRDELAQHLGKLHTLAEHAAEGLLQDITRKRGFIEGGAGSCPDRLAKLNLDGLLKEIPLLGGKLDTTGWASLPGQQKVEAMGALILAGNKLQEIAAVEVGELLEQIGKLQEAARHSGFENCRKLVELGVEQKLDRIPRTGHKLNLETWSGFSNAEQFEGLRDLKGLRDKLKILLDGPVDLKHIMFDTHASTGCTIWLLVFAVLFNMALLVYVNGNWTRAMSAEVISSADAGKRLREAASAIDALVTVRSRKEKTPSEGQKGDAEAADKLSRLVEQAEDKVRNTVLRARATLARGPSENSILMMVVMLGALGGSLHWLGSLVFFIGNRRLKRSWIPYYLSLPFRGAGLAVIVYLVLRVGLLTPSSPSTESATTSSLNLIGIYCIASLSGLFSGQAFEKLAEVFETMFKTARRRESRDKAGTGNSEKTESSES